MPLQRKQVANLPENLSGLTTSDPAPKKIVRNPPPKKKIRTNNTEPEYRGDITYDVPEFTKVFNVVDPDTGEVVGVFRYPHDGCPGLSCPESEGKTHALSFFKKGCFYIHAHCGLPSIKTASSYIRDVIEFKDGYKLPWESEPTGDGSTTP